MCVGVGVGYVCVGVSCIDVESFSCFHMNEAQPVLFPSFSLTYTSSFSLPFSLSLLIFLSLPLSLPLPGGRPWVSISSLLPVPPGN